MRRNRIRVRGFAMALALMPRVVSGVDAPTVRKAAEFASSGRKAAEFASPGRKAAEVAPTAREAAEIAPTARKVAEVAPTAREATEIALETGASRVLRHPGVTRIAVGNSLVVQATAVNGREVLVFGKTRGATTIDLWTASGKRVSYVVNVAPEGLRRIHAEISGLLGKIPNARSVIVGDKIVIEGEDIGDADQARIAALASRYPDVIDFTSQVGWDRMVLLDVQVIEIPSSRMQELGIRWDPASGSGMSTGLAWDAGSSRIDQRPGDMGINAAFPMRQAAGYLGLNALLSARLAAMSKTGEAVVLAQPQLLARSGSTASFLAGGEVPYASIDKDGKSTTTFKKYGVSLNITPHADRAGAIRSKVEIEVSSVDQTITVPGGPALKIRKASTEFNVRSGQTLVVGGFLSRERSSERDGLPGLSRLPLVGGLFGIDREQARETELAIFVTPVIVDAQHPDLQARVRSGNAIVAQAFPDANRLNHAVRPTVPGAAPNPFSPESSSQWDEEDTPPTDAPPSVARNEYDFDDAP